VKAAEALREGVARLRAAGVPDAPRDARLLLAWAMSIPAERLTLRLEDGLEPAVLERFTSLISQREQRRPVSQIIGQRLFWGRPFVVTREVLDPRPETEVLIAASLEGPFHRLADLGTGSGAILLTLLCERPAASGIGVDLSDEALDVARENAHLHGLDDRVAFVRSDWLASLSGRFDLIVSNPPYVSQAEFASLSPEVRHWEPTMALTPGGDGLDAYRIIVAGIARHLSPGGRLIFEIGPSQADAVLGMLSNAGFSGLEVRKDLDGRDRMLLARMSD
jgi:release factor glutamine methyltransferase